MESRRCVRCGETKSVENFYTHKKNGYHSWCKECCRIENQRRYNIEQWRGYYEKNSEKLDAYRREYQQKNKKRIAERCREYYRLNGERMR